MRLTDAGRDTLRALTRNRTFYVVDTEYTTPAADDPVRSSRLISIAIVPVRNGARGSVLYAEMNPTVPVSVTTQEKTGFTTEQVARERTFAYYAPRILAHLADPGAVFVAHTSADIRVLRGELERQSNAGRSPGLTQLPDLPILDTATLPRLLGLPGLPAHKGAISLAEVCAVLGVTHHPDQAHNARSDALVTAGVLGQLLAHAAQAGHTNLDDLLVAHGRGTTTTPTTPGKWSSVGDTHPRLPAAHLDRHGTLDYDDPTDSEQARQLLELAGECVRLRCENLNDEITAATAHAAALLPELWELLPTCTERGQAGTLIGAVQVLLPHAIPSTQLVKWWGSHKADLADPDRRCGTTNRDACPACRTSASCPLDVLYTTVAHQAALCGRPALTKETVKYKLFSAPGKKDRRIADWSANHPELAGYMAAMVLDWEDGNGGAVFAAKYLRDAASFGLHEIEPRFGLQYAQHLADTGHPDQAQHLAGMLLAMRTTDTAYDAIQMWSDRLRQHLTSQQRRDADVLPTRKPRMVRPRDRAHTNPYRLTE